MNKSFDPARLDVARFARHAGELEGEWRLGALPRLAETAVDPGSAAPVRWSARGESIRRSGRDEEMWLVLGAEAEVRLACQRCLQTMTQRLVLDTRIRFVHGEDAAARLDGEIEEDVLAVTRSLDLRELVEDELLLALPIVPRHEVCPEAPRSTPQGDESEATKVNPFAILGRLRAGLDNE